MTDAKLRPSPSSGHGLTPRILDRIYADRIAGRDPGTVVALVEFKAVEHGEKDTAEGTKRFVKWEAVKVEPELDPHEADRLRWRMKESWDKRHGGAQLPMDFATQNDDEQRRHLLGLVDEWAAEEGLTPTDVAERWRTQWGIDGDTAGTDGAFVHPDINKAAVHHVKEFAYMVGVLADAPETAADEDDASVSGASDEVEEADTDVVDVEIASADS